MSIVDKLGKGTIRLGIGILAAAAIVSQTGCANELSARDVQKIESQDYTVEPLVRTDVSREGEYNDDYMLIKQGNVKVGLADTSTGNIVLLSARPTRSGTSTRYQATLNQKTLSGLSYACLRDNEQNPIIPSKLEHALLDANELDYFNDVLADDSYLVACDYFRSAQTFPAYKQAMKQLAASN